MLAECHTDRKQNGGCQGLWGEKGNEEELVFHGHGVSFGVKEKIPEKEMLMVVQQFVLNETEVGA